MHVFIDRQDAGRALALALRRHAGQDVVVVGLPRGGVPVACEVARALGAELDVFVVRKLGVPGQPELAMGAIASGGVTVLNEDVLRLLGDRQDALRRVEERERQVLADRERLYRGRRPAVRLAGRTVIVVDDGLATGASMKAAVEAIGRQGASRVIVAVPVGPPESVAMLRGMADEVVCLQSPRGFTAVGAWYEDFSQTTDEEVTALLDAAGPAG